MPNKNSPLTVLALQGGGALGAYQAGAYEKLITQSEDIDWIAGISIGAINSALIAGNPREKRVQRLREFWEKVTLALPFRPDPKMIEPIRGWWDNAIASWGATVGIPGFFTPRNAWDWWPQPPASIYDTSALRETLIELVDFDLLNNGPMRFSVGAVDVQTGNLVYFDNQNEKIGPEHVMASGALPPGFGAVQVGKRWYWDGGLVSNTPLGYVMGNLSVSNNTPVTVFQIDLFCSRGHVPKTLSDSAEREKDIRYSSRTRTVTNLMRRKYQLHRNLRDMAALLPKEKQDAPEVRAMLDEASDPPVTLIHVIHRGKRSDTETKDYEFSRLSMTEHWNTGKKDMGASINLLHKQPPITAGEFRVLDYRAVSRKDRGVNPDATNTPEASPKKKEKP